MCVASNFMSGLTSAATKSTAKRTRIAYISFIEVHIFLGQIGGIHHRARLAEIQIDVQFKFLWRDGGAQFLEGRLRRLPALKAPENFLPANRAVTDVNFLLQHRRRRVTNRVNNAAPVRIA